MSIYACGDAFFCQLGVGSLYRKSLSPERIHWEEEAVTLAAGGRFSCAITHGGALWEWGCINDIPKSYPQRCLSQMCIVSVSCGRKHACCVSDTGNVYTWGCGLSGRLGHGDLRSYEIPKAVATLKPDALSTVEVGHVISCSCGASHTGCITTKGCVFLWGGNRYSQCRGGNASDVWFPHRLKHRTLDKSDPTQLALGFQHSVILLRSGVVLTMGYAKNGSLGRLGRPDVPLPANLREKCIGISCGMHHTAALSVEGRVYTWGSGNEGQLGHGTTHECPKPTMVYGLSRILVTRVSCGDWHTIAMAKGGSLYGWGAGDSGCFGLGEDDEGMLKPLLTPTELLLCSALPVASVACGGGHTLLLCGEGTCEESEEESAISPSHVAYPTVQARVPLSRTNSMRLAPPGGEGGPRKLVRMNTMPMNYSIETEEKRKEEAKMGKPLYTLDDDDGGALPRHATGEELEEVTKLFSHARHNRVADVRAHLEDGFEVDSRDANGNTLLHVFAQNGIKKGVKVALRFGGDICAVNYMGKTPLDFAASYGFDSLARYMVQKGAE